MSYKQEDLQRLHAVLLDILKEIIRVCDILNIEYFIQGGTAIGAFFDQGFVPWDDDIDLGMTRKNYERFVKQAPTVLAKGYFIQSFETEPRTPFYFVKVRKDNTLFIEYPYKDMPIHHGIFVDIFPFDNVPDNPHVERLHRRIVQYLEGSFKRRQMRQAHFERFSRLPKPAATLLSNVCYGLMQLMPRQFFYWRLRKVQSLFNKKRTNYVSIVKMPLDQISTDAVEHSCTMSFEGIPIKAPDQIEVYLRHHYPHLAPTLPADKQVNHAPYVLSFDTKTSE